MNKKRMVAYIIIALVIVAVMLEIISLLINQQSKLRNNNLNTNINSEEIIMVPYANQTIHPKTLITADMISYMKIVLSSLKNDYYIKASDIINMYSSTVIPSGSFFYKNLLVTSADLPDSTLQDIPNGYTVVNYAVNMEMVYINSMYPGRDIDIYFNGVNDDEKVMFGKFMSDIRILDVRDNEGQKVFESSDDVRTPAYILFAVPEEWNLLIRKALYLNKYSVKLTLVPSTETYDGENVDVVVSRKEIERFILDKTTNIDISELPSTTDENVTTPD